MKTKLSIIICSLLFSFTYLLGQDSPLRPRPQLPNRPDSLVIPSQNFPTIQDTVPPSIGSGGFETAENTNPFSDLSKILISDDAVESQVDYDAKDSMYFDIKKKQIHLYGEAIVKYESMTIEAEYIIIDWENNIVTAEGKRNAFGEMIGSPKFKEKDQEFTSSKMRYNIKTQKGIIYDAVTEQGGMHVHGSKAKFISSGDEEDKDDLIYNKDAIFTTCNHSEPHFGIRSKKQVVVPNKVAVVGPSNIEIQGIPTPFWLPFGFFPLKQGKRTGLIFPQGYEYSPNFGFGLEGIGWYFPINDHLDLQLTGDVYMKGSTRIHAYSRYAKRYKFNGTLRMDYARLRNEVNGMPVYDPSFSINWSHNQDRKAHPYQSFGGTLNFQTGNYTQANQDDFQSVTTSTIRSNISYRRSFEGPFSLSVGFNHSQNTESGRININFPTVNFQTQTLYPFKRDKAKKKAKNRNKDSWYEKITLRYTGEAKNTLTGIDSTFFQKKTLDDARYGVRHSVSSNVNFRVLKFFNLSPNVNYKEVWYFKTLHKEFDPTLGITQDTSFNALDSSDFTIDIDTTFGEVLNDTTFGFRAFRQYNAGVSLNTQLFGTLLFKKGWLRGVRHVIKPNFSFNFTPDYTNPDWGYFEYVQTDLREEELERYNIFQNGIYDRPSESGRQMALSYAFNNIFEAKVFSKKDSTEKKLKLFRNINVGGNYNFAADSLKFSTVRISGTTDLFNDIANFRFNMTLDPYVEKDGKRIDRLYWREEGKFLRYVKTDFSIGARMTVRRLRDLINGVKTNDRTSRTADSNTTQEETPKSEDIISILEDFSFDYNFNFRIDRLDSGKDSTYVTAHSLRMRGGIPITDNWNIRVDNIGYDFRSKQLAYPSIGFTRDLHCWEMGFFWAPERGTYSFYLKVKPGQLDFINLPYNRGRQDVFR